MKILGDQSKEIQDKMANDEIDIQMSDEEDEVQGAEKIEELIQEEQEAIDRLQDSEEVK